MRVALRTAVCTVAAAALVPWFVPAASADPGSWYTGIDGGELAARWTADTDGPQPYSGIVPELAVPITMSDGVVLKADVIHPAAGGAIAPGKRPVILQIQGYGKIAMNVGNALLQIPGIESVLFPWLAQFNFSGGPLAGITDLTSQLDSGAIPAAIQSFDLAKAGYTLVQVDLRGTGTSQGDWQIFGDRERRDTQEVIDWITRQPWSDGTVGAMGTSFTAITALQAADRGNPALKAVFGYVPSADILTDIVAPGGGVGFGFLPFWLLAVNLAKTAPDIEALLAGRFDPAEQLKWLQDRLADPMTFMDVVLNAYGSTSMDQLSQKVRDIITPGSPFRRAMITDIGNISAATFIVEAWYDIFGTTPTATFNGMTKLSDDEKKLLMGDGYHLGAGVGGLGHPGNPPRLDVLQRAWFDHWLRGFDNGIEHYSPLTLKQEGGGWRAATQFPREEVTYRRMYLDDQPSGTAGHAVADGGLSAEPRQAGIRNLTVAPSLASLCSRDTARIFAGGTAIIVGCTDDSRIWETAGLAFTSAPVGSATTISGPISVHLNVVEDAADGYWVATVNDVAPDGRSREISTGQLVASLREIDDDASLKSANGDYTQPSYHLDLDRRRPTVPGQPLTLDIALTPIDAVLQPGHRLRIDVYASNFPKGLPPTPILVDSGLRPQHLRLDPDAPSWVNLAVDTDIPD